MTTEQKITRALAIAAVALAALLAWTPTPLAAGELTTEWKLEDIFADLEAWNAAKTEIPKLGDKIASFKGSLDDPEEGAANLRKVLELDSEADKQLTRLQVYAGMLSDLDVRKPGPQGMREEMRQLGARLLTKSSWIAPEILSLSPQTIERYLEEEPGLAPFRRDLERLEKQRPHVLDEAGEELLSMTAMMAGNGITIGSILRNAEIPWPTITLSDGSELRVDTTGYSRGRAMAKREDRITTYDAFYGALEDFQQSLAAALAATVKRHVFTANVRKYEDTLAVALAGSEVERAAFDTLIEEINNSLPTLHRYFKLRARMLDIDDLRYHDLYPSMVSAVSEEYPWDKSAEVVLASFEPMGEDYVDYLRTACESGWVDVYPREGKRAGAYVNGAVYDVHPFMLLNHRDDYSSASTFAHEAGHMMHSALSNAAQPYPMADYETFVAEVASTTQQWLFFRYTLEQATSDDEKLAILGSHLDSLRTTVFRQTMFVEFERAIHKMVEQGKPITSEVLNATYLELLRRYHGHDQGVCTIDEKYQVEWAFVPHFHYNYYVYTYATSWVAATAFHQLILSEEGGAQRYIDGVLKAGSSKPPVEILRDAGVDMTTPEPYRATMKELERIMDQIEEILDRRGE